MNTTKDMVDGCTVLKVWIPAQALQALKVHPYAAETPPMSAESLKRLRNDMKEKGYDASAPLVLDGAGEVLIDGRNRCNIAMELGVTVPALKVAFPDDDAIQRYIFKASFARRNLAVAEQHAMIRKLAATKSVKVIAEWTGYSERRVQELTEDIRAARKAEEQKKVEASKAAGKSERTIAKETGRPKSTVHDRVPGKRGRRGNRAGTKPSHILPPRIHDLTNPPGPRRGRYNRARTVLATYTRVANDTGLADAWLKWCDGYVNNNNVTNSEYVVVANGFPKAHAAIDFDRAYTIAEAALFFAALGRANAGDAPLPEDRDRDRLIEARSRGLRADRRANSLFRKYKPTDWAPDMAKRHGYDPDDPDKPWNEIAFAAEYSQKMGHVTTRTEKVRDKRKRLVPVDDMWSKFRAAIVAIGSERPPLLTIYEWRDDTEADRRGRCRGYIAEMQRLCAELDRIMVTEAAPAHEPA